MVFESTFNKRVQFLMNFFILGDYFDINRGHTFEDKLGQLGKSVILIVLTDSKVNEVACDTVDVGLH